MTRIAATILLLSLTASQIDVEISAYIASRRKVMDETSRPIAERETVAVELASTLDRAARTEEDSAKRRALWAEARAMLDGFSSRNPDHPRARLFAYQAAVYLWAEAESWTRQAERNPSDANAIARAASSYEAASARLKPLHDGDLSNDVLSQNIRFRLAQSLFDRSRIHPDRPASPKLRDDALDILTAKPISEKSLAGFAEFLKAKILAASGRFDEANDALESSSRAEVAPPLADRLMTLVPIASGRKRLTEARAALEAATLDGSIKERLRIQFRLEERRTLDPGSDRDDAESDTFRRIAALKTTSPTDARMVLMDLARALDEPGPKMKGDAWSLLAEGAALLGQTERAARLGEEAAAREISQGDLASARASRFRAAALWFEAQQFARADALLSEIVADPKAGALRPKAGMLRALGRGRGLAKGEAGITRASYESSLADQIAHFSDDPTAGEARWLLGLARFEEGDRDEAERLWQSIPQTHPRWIDAQLAEARLSLKDLEGRRLVDLASDLIPQRNTARARLEKLASEARDDVERGDVDLERIRLELVRNVGDPREALAMIDRLLRLPLQEDQRGNVERLRIVALAATENDLEAERLAQDLPRTLSSKFRLALARDLEDLTDGERSERKIRKIAAVIRGIVDSEGLFAPNDLEAKLRRTRAKMLSGDIAGTREILDAWPDAESAFSGQPELQNDMAELLFAARDFEKAVRAYQILSRREMSGSPRWFAARLGLARSLLSAGQREAARKLVQGAALLHPDFGGKGMKANFEAVRVKIENP